MIRMLKFIFIYCLYFIFFLNCSQCRSSTLVSELESFTNAFNGVSPFYAITVARDTITESYGSIAPEEKNLVFSLLKVIISGDNKNFIEMSEKLIREKEQWFTKIKIAIEESESRLDPSTIINQIIDQEAQIFTRVPAFRNFLGFGGNEAQQKKDFKESIKRFILDSIQQKRAENLSHFRIRLREAFSVQDKVSNTVFETKSQEILDFINTFDEIFEKMKHDMAEKSILNHASEITVFERYKIKIGKQKPIEFFGSIFKNIQHIYAISQKIYNERIRTHPCLIVFNEMFFAKDIPLSSESNEYRVIKSYLEELTHEHTNVLLHVNLLYETVLNYTEDRYRSLMAEQARRVNALSSGTRKQVFESDLYRDYTEYEKQFTNYTQNLNVIKNISSVFWKGTPIISYLKSSYRTEADSLLENKLYVFGTAEDTILAKDNTLEKEVATLLSHNISTEICYDLEIGVRKALNVYPPTGKIHVIVSNTLSLAQANRADNLPAHIPLIIHVDPKDQEVMLNNETLAILSPGIAESTSGDPLHENRFNQFTKAMPIATFRVNLTDNNVFIFHIWDLQQCLQTASMYSF